jgi:hypothetical protein
MPIETLLFTNIVVISFTYRKYFLEIAFYLQSLLVHLANCVKKRIQRHVEECSVALLCN